MARTCHAARCCEETAGALVDPHRSSIDQRHVRRRPRRSPGSRSVGTLRRGNRSPHAARCPAPPPARGGRHLDREGRLRDPRLAVQDQPHRDRPGRPQAARHRRPAHAVRRDRTAGAVADPGPGQAVQYARLVDEVRRPAARLVRVLPRTRIRGRHHPWLPGPVHPRPVPDRGLCASRHPARPSGRVRRGDRTPRHAALAAPGTSHPAGLAPGLDDHGRGGASPPLRRRRRDARPAQAPPRRWPACRT